MYCSSLFGGELDSYISGVCREEKHSLELTVCLLCLLHILYAPLQAPYLKVVWGRSVKAVFGMPKYAVCEFGNM